MLNSFPKIGKMKLKFLPILAGSTFGWTLPASNFTNPCEDFQVSRASLFKGKTISWVLKINDDWLTVISNQRSN